MITGISIVSVWVLDQESAKEFYTKQLGFEVTTDLKLDNGMRWLTVRPPGSTNQELVLADPSHSMLDLETAEQVRALVAKGALSPGVMSTTDRHAGSRRTGRAGRGVHPASGRPPVRNRGRHARRLRQLVQLHPAQIRVALTPSRALVGPARPASGWLRCGGSLWWDGWCQGGRGAMGPGAAMASIRRGRPVSPRRTRR